MQIGHVISQLRNQKKISQKKLASDLNVSPGLVGLWETNKRVPSLEVFTSLIDYFAVSADLLLENDRELKPNQYQNFSDKIPIETKKLLKTFSLLNEDNRDILLGESKKLLKQQQSEEKNTQISTIKAT